MRKRLLVVLPLLVFACTGCIRADFAIRINEDGSGTVSALLAVNRELAGALTPGLGGDAGAAADFALSPSEIDPADLPAEALVEEYRDGDFEGVRITVPFTEGTNVADRLSEVIRASAGEDGGDDPFDILVLERRGDEWIFEAQLADDTADFGAEIGGSARAFLETLFADASFTMRIEFPDEILEHNADEVNGRELVWNLDFLSPGDRTLMARSGPSGEGSTPWLVIGILAALAIVAVAALAYWIRARQAPAS